MDPSLAEQLARLGAVALAGGLGGMIGFERELRHKPAGIRTHAFVAAGSCLLLLLGIDFAETYRVTGETTNIRIDPLRMAQGLLTALCFIGAGTIIQHRERGMVEGLTTAAAMLVSAGVGIAVAFDQWILAAGTSLLVIVSMLAIGALERRLGSGEHG